MSLSFDDDELGEVTEFKLKKTEIVNPEVKKDTKITPVFLSNEDRQKIYLEELRKIDQKGKEREKLIKENVSLYLNSRDGRYISGK